MRIAGGFSTVPPSFASAAALESHPDAFIGTSYFVRLAGGRAGYPELEAGIEDLVGDRTLPPEAEEFSVVDVSDTSIAAASIDNTALLLGRALLLLALSTAVVGGVAVTQALARHHTATARAREVEQALGMTRAQQTSARLLSGLLPAALATALAAIGAIAAAGIEPIGAVDLYEPHPGTAINVTVLLVGLAVVFAGVLAATALTGAIQGRRRSDAPVRESSVVNRVSRVGGTPPTVLGLRFALEAGRGARAVPVRSAIIGATVGVAGVVAGLVFVSSLDRLIESPSRSAIPYDVGIADVTRDDLERTIMDDPLVGDVSVIESAPLLVDGLSIDGHAIDALRGSLDIGIQEGRLPRTPDEITLGLRAAQDLDVGAGDTVTSRQARRAHARARRGRRRRGPDLQRRGARTQRARDLRGSGGERDGGGVQRRGGGGGARRGRRGAHRAAGVPVRGRCAGGPGRGPEPRAARAACRRASPRSSARSPCWRWPTR